MTDLGIGDLFHLAQVGLVLGELDDWYRTVFSPRYFADHLTDLFPTWEAEKRDARLFAIADSTVEIMAPARHLEGWEQYPVGRFLHRFGPHWHSLAWYVDDIRPVYERLTDRGIRVVVGGAPGADGPGPDDALFTHPKDTGVALEFMRGPTSEDPRFLPGWSNDWWAENHPLGLTGLSHVSMAVRDRDLALNVFAEVLGGVVVGERVSAIDGTTGVVVRVGTNTDIELATPDRPDSLMGRDLAANGPSMHSVTWRLRNLDAAVTHVESAGVAVYARDDTTVVLDPATTLGATVRLSTESPTAS
jgi:catechol 2,3-dioxygenase-like lactoylglutathione lyase family enzyme